jgi:hypothetical protein
MSKTYSSFEEQHMLFENWRRYTQSDVLTEAEVNAEELVALWDELTDDPIFQKVYAAEAQNGGVALNEATTFTGVVAWVDLVEDVLKRVVNNRAIQEQSPKVGLKAAKYARKILLWRKTLLKAYNDFWSDPEIMAAPLVVKKALGSLLRIMFTHRWANKPVAFLTDPASRVLNTQIRLGIWLAEKGFNALYGAIVRKDPKKIEAFWKVLSQQDREMFAQIAASRPYEVVKAYFEEIEPDYKKKPAQLPIQEPKPPETEK